MAPEAPLPPHVTAALATDPTDRAPGQEEPGSEDEAGTTEFAKGEMTGGDAGLTHLLPCMRPGEVFTPCLLCSGRGGEARAGPGGA